MHPAAATVRSRVLLALIGLAVVVGLAYLPCLTVRYAVLDDYAEFVKTRSWAGSKELMAAMTSDGRPLYGVIVAAAFGATGSIGDFGFLRAWTLLWILATAACIVRLGRSRGLDGWLAVCAGAAWSMLPSLQVLVNWAQVGVGQAPAVFLAWVAAAVVDGGPDRPTWRRRLAGGIAIHALAICIHQAAAMTFWAFVLLRLLWSRVGDDVSADQQRHRRRDFYWRAIATGSIAMLLGFAVVKMVPWFGFPSSVRGALVSDPLHKLSWFVQQPLPRAMQLFSLNRSVSWACLYAACYAVIGGWLFRRSGRSLREWVTPGVAVAALLVLSYAPNLVIAQDWPSYRSLVGLASGCLFLAITMYHRATVDRFENWIRFVPVVVVCLLVVKTHTNSTTLFAHPQAVEFREVRAQVQSAAEAGIRTLVARRAGPSDGIAAITLGDEFGARSGHPPWGMRYLVLAALEDLGLDSARFRVVVCDPGEPAAGIHVDARRIGPRPGRPLPGGLDSTGQSTTSHR